MNYFDTTYFALSNTDSGQNPAVRLESSAMLNKKQTTNCNKWDYPHRLPHGLKTSYITGLSQKQDLLA